MENAERKKFEKVLKKNGFKLDRFNGDHMIWKHPDGRLASVPMCLHRYTMNTIAKKCGISYHK